MQAEQKIPEIHSLWLQALGPEFQKPYMQQLHTFLAQRKGERVVIYPRGVDFFRAFNMVPLPKVKVVILGQDPYHNPGQAHGLSFSVPEGVSVPPSLRNIYKEISQSCGGKPPESGNLEAWAQQGVLLLNSVLTVEANTPGAHRGKGWEAFTDHAIETISQTQQAVVFMLWGAYARSKVKFIDARKHLVLEAPHPSPLSAHRGFLGCGHFKMANAYLIKNGKTPINWLPK